MLPSLVAALVPVITLPIFSRQLTIDEYGVYALCLALGTFVSGLANMGLTTGYERNFFEQQTPEEHGKLLFSVVLFVTLSCLFFGFIVALLKVQLSLWITGSRNYGYSFVNGYFAVSISTLKQYFLLYYKNVGNARSYAWFSIDETLINMLLGIFLVVYYDMGVNGLLIGQLTGALIVTLLLIIRFIKTLPLGISGKLIKNCFIISLPLTPRIFFGVIGTQFDKYLISLLGTLGGVGLYNIGQKIAYVVFNYMTALQNVYSPRVYKMMFEHGNDDSGNIGRFLSLPFFASAFGGLGVGLFAEEIIYILTPEPYHNASGIVSVLSLMYVVYFFGKQPQLVYAKKTGLISVLTLISIVINIVISIPMIKFWGSNGAAFASLVAAILSGIVLMIISQKYFTIRWEKLKLTYTLVALFLFVFVHLLLLNIQVDWIWRFLIKILMVIAYVAGAFYLDIITRAMVKPFVNFRIFSSGNV